MTESREALARTLELVLKDNVKLKNRCDQLISVLRHIEDPGPEFIGTLRAIARDAIREIKD